jgi:predicted RNA polymerase sigma factor
LNLEELYERHGERIYRYLLFRLGSAEDAEDVLQEAFCRFARYDLRWRLVRDPQAFVFRVARNEGEGFIVYSLGSNEKDDRGRSTYMITQMVMEKDDDWAWREDR